RIEPRRVDLQRLVAAGRAEEDRPLVRREPGGFDVTPVVRDAAESRRLRRAKPRAQEKAGGQGGGGRGGAEDPAEQPFPARRGRGGRRTSPSAPDPHRGLAPDSPGPRRVPT